MTKRAPLLQITALGASLVSVVFASRPAFAQYEPPPAETSPPPAARTTSRSSVGGGPGAGLGIGGAAFVSGLAGAEVDYDTAIWDIEGILAFSNTQVGGGMNPPRQTTFDIGVSGWYHFNVGTNSDFSLGGGVGIVTASTSNGGGSLTAVVFEPGIRVRAFVTPNVAVFGRVGLPFVFGDDVGGVTGNTSVRLANQLTGGFGFTYYFR
jgi:hypothetical protein